MSNVTHLDDHRPDPHAVIETVNAIHVVPIVLVKKWINGEIAPDEDCVRRIIQEWLERIYEL